MLPDFFQRGQHGRHQFNGANLAFRADAGRPGRAAAANPNHQHIFRIRMDQWPHRAQELMDGKERNASLAEALDEEGTFRHAIRALAVAEKGHTRAIFRPGHHMARPFRMHARPKPSIAWHEHERERGGNGKAAFDRPPPPPMPKPAQQQQQRKCRQ